MLAVVDRFHSTKLTGSRLQMPAQMWALDVDYN